MTTPDSVRERLLKVLRLARQGVGGERENAEALLAKLLTKHGLTMADLEEPEGASRTEWFAATDAEEQVVLSQLAMRLFGTARKLWKRAGSWDVGLDVTASERAALLVGWEVYRAAFSDARHALVLGFCLKHDLYAATGSAAPPMSAEEEARARRAMAMAETLPDVRSPGRRLAAPGDDGR